MNLVVSPSFISIIFRRVTHCRHLATDAPDAPIDFRARWDFYPRVRASLLLSGARPGAGVASHCQALYSKWSVALTCLNTLTALGYDRLSIELVTF
ncbi:hypothetical protein NDU88_005912 [Pleurodeles waltl]|uniref:Uncharacterized protein n=1 Tax=Pleurodeles waltl TaxID=8319 RepID=A0AAV7RME1_PLEWA|nr:hypothetical protein NDU88_005912 [Pleurodeles waltl]